MKPSQNEKPDGTNGKRLGIGTWNKQIINTATWNVRTMLVPKRMIEVANEMQSRSKRIGFTGSQVGWARKNRQQGFYDVLQQAKNKNG